MRKLLILLVAATMMMACGRNPKAVDSKQLQGKYEVDLAELVQKELDGEDELTKAFAAFMLSQMHMTFEFEEEHLVIDASETMRGLLNSFSEDEKMPVVVDYKIVNDSVFYTREKDKDWKEAGVLRKVSESYDILQWVVVKDDEGEAPTILTLRKTAE